MGPTFLEILSNPLDHKPRVGALWKFLKIYRRKLDDLRSEFRPTPEYVTSFPSSVTIFAHLFARSSPRSSLVLLLFSVPFMWYSSRSWTR